MRKSPQGELKETPPQMRGTIFQEFELDSKTETPPQTRGTHVLGLVIEPSPRNTPATAGNSEHERAPVSIATRNTPATAGNSLGKHPSHNPLQKHPRNRGELYGRFVFGCYLVETPPQPRGTLGVSSRAKHFPGNTPATAGNSQSRL